MLTSTYLPAVSVVRREGNIFSLFVRPLGWYPLVLFMVLSGRGLSRFCPGGTPCPVQSRLGPVLVLTRGTLSWKRPHQTGTGQDWGCPLLRQTGYVAGGMPHVVTQEDFLVKSTNISLSNFLQSDVADSVTQLLRIWILVRRKSSRML